MGDLANQPDSEYSSLGVDRAQGALLGSPVPLAELMTWMKPR